MASKTVYSHAMRVLLCAECGAPIEVPLIQGTARCSYCQAVNHLMRRDESEDLARAKAGPTISEAARFQQLRAQDGKPLVAPPALQHLIRDGGLDPTQAQMAMTAWQTARTEILQGASFGSYERLYFLTMMLYSYLSDRRDDLRTRAMLESAVELFADARHRQVCRGMLARNAARLGDIHAAEEWLEPCDPHSTDLDSDTAYRISKSYVATAKGDFNSVLQLLGHQRDDVPIADGQDQFASVLRANAHERTGSMPRAIAELTHWMTTSANGVQVVERIVSSNSELRLCTASFPAARQQVAVPAAAGGIIHTRGGANINVGCMLGAIFGAVAIFLVVLFAGLAAIGPAITAIAVPVFIIGIFVLVFGFIIRASSAAKQIKATGVPGRARLLGMEGTGTRINGQPVMLLHMEVQIPSHAPYQVMHKEIVPYGKGRLFPNAMLPVYVDRNDSARMMVDWTGA